jgi:hypothetical protein
MTATICSSVNQDLRMLPLFPGASLSRNRWSEIPGAGHLGLPLTRRRIAEISEGVVENATAVASELSRPGLDQWAIEQFADMIRARAPPGGVLDA